MVSSPFGQGLQQNLQHLRGSGSAKRSRGEQVCNGRGKWLPRTWCSVVQHCMPTPEKLPPPKNTLEPCRPFFTSSRAAASRCSSFDQSNLTYVLLVIFLKESHKAPCEPRFEGHSAPGLSFSCIFCSSYVPGCIHMHLCLHGCPVLISAHLKAATEQPDRCRHASFAVRKPSFGKRSRCPASCSDQSHGSLWFCCLGDKPIAPPTSMVPTC